MLVNNYLSVAMFQLNVELECNSREEYLVETNDVLKQIENCLEVIKEYEPDISLFPEMTYLPKFEKEFVEISKSRIIVAGSFYKEDINTTVVFADGIKYEIVKAYASGAEPMARKISFVPTEKFLEEELENHAFWIKGKKIYILNCMEYYHAAYYIARNRERNTELFGIFAICSNSNSRVFEEETVCIHNHNERIYTFVLNCVGTYQGQKYADGQSYIYGPVSIHEKEWLRAEKIASKQNVSHILSMSAEKAQFLFGKFVFSEELSRFGRSDSYLNNPRDIVVKNIRRE